MIYTKLIKGGTNLKDIVSALYTTSRKVGKMASTANDISQLKKSIETKDPSHIVNRMARKNTRKATHKGADQLANQVNKLFK